MAYPRFQRARDFKLQRYTGANLSLSNTGSWVNLPTIGTSYDIVLSAQAGDCILVNLSAFHQNQAETARLDMWTIVGGSPVNQFGTAAFGVPGWVCIFSQYGSIGSSVAYELTGGDISSNTVTLRLRYRTDGAGTKVIETGSMLWSAQNLGPKDPN